MVPAEGAFGDPCAAGAAWPRGGQRDVGRMQGAGHPCSPGTGGAGDLLQRGRPQGREEREPRAARAGEAGPAEAEVLPGGFSRPSGRRQERGIPDPRAAPGCPGCWRPLGDTSSPAVTRRPARSPPTGGRGTGGGLGAAAGGKERTPPPAATRA